MYWPEDDKNSVLNT